jgi:hypothetical protein
MVRHFGAFLSAFKRCVILTKSFVILSGVAASRSEALRSRRIPIASSTHQQGDSIAEGIASEEVDSVLIKMIQRVGVLRLHNLVRQQTRLLPSG